MHEGFQIDLESNYTMDEFQENECPRCEGLGEVQGFPCPEDDCTANGIATVTLLDQYRTALENFGVTFADNGLIRKIPRHRTEARYRNALTEILTLRSRHAKDCHIVAREALKGAQE